MIQSIYTRSYFTWLYSKLTEIGMTPYNELFYVPNGSVDDMCGWLMRESLGSRTEAILAPLMFVGYSPSGSANRMGNSRPLRRTRANVSPATGANIRNYVWSQFGATALVVSNKAMNIENFIEHYNVQLRPVTSLMTDMTAIFEVNNANFACNISQGECNGAVELVDKDRKGNLFGTSFTIDFTGMAFQLTPTQMARANKLLVDFIAQDNIVHEVEFDNINT